MNLNWFRALRCEGEKGENSPSGAVVFNCPWWCVLGRKSGGVGNLRAKDTGLVETLETRGRGV